MGIGSKNASATPAVTAVGVLLLGLTFLPFVYTLPYYVNMILQVPLPPFHASREGFDSLLVPTA